MEYIILNNLWNPRAASTTKSSVYQEMLHNASSNVDFNVGEGVYMLPSNMLFLMGNKWGFNNNILVSGSNFKPVNLSSVSTASKAAPKEVSKVAPKVLSKAAPKAASKAQPTTDLSRLPHEERILSQEIKDKMMAVSVLLIYISLVFLYFFK